MSDTRRKLMFLDGLRGLAALYVLVGHARWLLWEGFAEGYRTHPDHYSLAGKLLVFGWVALAVVLCVGVAWPLHLFTERPFLPRPAKPYTPSPQV